MNMKIVECENTDFLPQQYKDRTDLIQSEKNVLATLCYLYLRYSDYVREHDGWFFTSEKELEAESGIDKRTVFRILVKLGIRGLVYRKSGTNHKCTHYKLAQEITELLPKVEVPEEETEEANVILVKNRLDESSKDEDSRSGIITENNESHAPLEGAAPTECQIKKKSKEELDNELQEHKRTLIQELEEKIVGLDSSRIIEVSNAVISSYIDRNHLLFEPYTSDLSRSAITWASNRKGKALWEELTSPVSS